MYKQYGLIFGIGFPFISPSWQEFLSGGELFSIRIESIINTFTNTWMQICDSGLTGKKSIQRQSESEKFLNILSSTLCFFAKRHLYLQPLIVTWNAANFNIVELDLYRVNVFCLKEIWSILSSRTFCAQRNKRVRS
ncbi:MAG: hypothetical protein DWQ10_11455 [Calditrichaeota bacterium]|nr:MAG: hypothetical protein DWQ10_11455 [Calditrichota bacterium]